MRWAVKTNSRSNQTGRDGSRELIPGSFNTQTNKKCDEEAACSHRGHESPCPPHVVGRASSRELDGPSNWTDPTCGLSLASGPELGQTLRMSKKEVDAYLATLNEPKRSTLSELRQTILTIIPDAEECISYGSPAFRLEGKLVAGFAAFKEHLSYFPHSGSVFIAMPSEVSSYPTSKGALRFEVDAPLPRSLVERLLTVRIDQMREDQARRKPTT